MDIKRPTLRTILIATVTCLFAGAHVLAADEELDFARDVRPVLAKNCFKCHGPDEGTREGGFRLDVGDAVGRPADSGEVPIVAGDPQQSELVRRIFADDPDERMPPSDLKQQLTDEQKETLRRWIAEGAEYTRHWAFVAPVKPVLPRVAKQDWPREAIDHFILARLEAQGLRPSPPADRYTLIRRVSLDLIGLPPKPDEVDAFVNDSSPGAYERLVDRLLESPHYGERWARRWLDLARYADTNGYEKDRPRSIWPYRDWVMAALNADMPFDRFTIEQIAGDMLEGATLDERIATGFHRNTMLNEEGGIDPLEFRFHAMTDRVATTGTTWLGLTLGCAQCHSHKYDPLAHREYYQLMAFLDNADEPELDLPDPVFEERYRQQLIEAEQLLADLPGHWPLEEVRWQTPQPLAATSTADQPPETLEDGSVLFPSPGPDKDVATIVIETAGGGVDRLRIEALTHDSLPKSGPGRTPHGNFVLSELTVTARPADGDDPSTPVRIVSAEADAEQEGFPVMAAFDGDDATGWAVQTPGKPLNTVKTATFQFEQPLPADEPLRLTVTLRQQHGSRHTLGRVRLSLGAPVVDPRPESERRQKALERSFAAWLDRERTRTVAWTPLRPVEMTSNLPLLTLEENETVFVSGDTSKLDVYELTYSPDVVGVTAIRLEALPDDRLPAHGPGMTYYEGTKGDFFLGELEVTADGVPVRIAGATESYGKNRYGDNPVSAALCTDGNVQTGWSVHGRLGERHTAVFVFEESLKTAGQLWLKMTFGRHFASSLGRFRVSVTTEPRGGEARDLPENVEALLVVADDRLSEADRETLRTAFLLQAPELAQYTKRISDLRLRPAATTTLVMQERPAENPRPTHIHHRGEFLQPTDRVDADVPAFLPPIPEGASRDRLGFARWIVSADNPLTARVAVNRQWAAFFGRGIVATQQDFGIQGEPPTHPDLLDRLAVEFIEDGWSMKRLHKRIVMSATYRQSSRVTGEHLQRDPDNRLLARAPRVRLEAEVIRDSLLSASGLLSPRIGGPSVYPPQPASVTTEGTYGALPWTASEGEDRYRRSLYTFSKRTAPFAMYAVFDGPSGEACVARRDASNTPLQALTLLNDEMFTEAAQAFGREFAAADGSAQDRITTLFRCCLTRPPTDEEIADLLAFFNAQRERFESGELDASLIAGEGEAPAADRAAWTVTARVLLNLDETITRP